MTIVNGQAVLLLGAGGTISALGANEMDFHNYPMTGNRLLAQDLAEIARPYCPDIDIIPSGFQPVSSTELGPVSWGNLITEIDQVAQKLPELTGIVVTHGTETLEETAFVLDLYVQTAVPLVVTGAIRPMNAMSTDAKLNLVSSVHLAASTDATDRGVLVALNGTIHSAKDVVKAENSSLAAFRSSPHGQIGTVDGKQVAFARSALRPEKRFEWLGSDKWPRVEIVMSYAGADGSLIDAVVASGAQGIVVSGLAPGYATLDQRRALRAARSKGISVVMSTRAESGPTYALEQNQVDGLIGSGWLNPAKARLLLAACLMSEHTEDEIAATLSRFSKVSY